MEPGPDWLGPARDLALVGLVLVACWTDVRTRKIKNWLTFPVAAVGVVLTGWAGPPWAGVVGLFGVLLVWDGRDGVPAFASAWWTPHVANNWSAITVWYVLGAAVVLGVLTLLQPGWEVRSVLWAAWCGGVFFWVWSGVEWMKGYRWGSLLAVPYFTLFAVGLGVWIRRLPLWATTILAGVCAAFAPKMPTLPWDAARKPLLSAGLVLRTPDLWVQWVALAAVGLLLTLVTWWLEGRGRVEVPARPMLHLGVLAGVLALPNIGASWDYAHSPETSPNSVHRRVNYMRRVQEKLDLEEVTLLDVDMGAHMWWARDWTIGDMAGLIDLPMARHIKYPKAFIDDYVFGELRPDFAHVHGSWAKTTKIPQNPRWKKEYVEIPGYPSGGTTLHVGNHVRKDLLAGPTYDIPEGRQARFASGVVLAGWRMPAPLIATGGKLWLDTAWNGTKRAEGFRVLVLFAPVKVEGEAQVFASDLAPGYDWYKPEVWSPNEFVWGRWSVPIPASLPKGTWELGFAVIDEATGAVLPFETTGNAATDPAPGAPVRYMAGEFWTGGTFELSSPEVAAEAAGKAYERGLAEATDGKCEDAQESFRNARRHVPRNESWYQARRADMDAAVVGCLVRRAEAEGDELARARILVAARKVDFQDERLAAACASLGASLESHGDDARAVEDWETAYRYFAASVAVDPTRSWARRKAEEARDWRLGLGVAKGKTGAASKPRPASKPPPAEVEDLEQRFGGAGD